MALKVYGAVDSVTGIEFMIRARSDDSAQITLDLLQAELDNLVGNDLILQDFVGPLRLRPTLVAENFVINGPVNGAST